ncbi:MAG: enoyl-CoA hydratase/isomerase family protein [Alphaproteobacteria bacterium]|nr:enoyl-CoA hydratase/isomerase family protein [Alphaproteobacteria bacterium]
MPSSTQTTYPTILLDVTDGVATVTLNRPQKHNAFNEQMIADLTAVFKKLKGSDEVKVAVLRGEGKSFSAGADLDYMQKMAGFTFDENVADAMHLAEMLETVHEFAQAKPLIGKVHGNALGGGAGLVALCDYVLADDTTNFGFPEVRLGLRPSTISPYVLDRIGHENALTYFSMGITFNAGEARGMGLVHELAVGGQMEDRLRELVALAALKGRDGLLEERARDAYVPFELPTDRTVWTDMVTLIQNVEALSKAGDRQALMEFTARDIATARCSEKGRKGIQTFLESRGVGKDSAMAKE